MQTKDQNTKNDEFSVYDKIDTLRTDYLRELSSLSRIFVTISSAILGLTLAPLAPDIFPRTGLTWLVCTWVSLAVTTALGLTQIFFFSSRFKVQADYLWASHLTDAVVQFDGTDEKIEEFSKKADRHKKLYDRQYKICVALFVGQTIALFVAFACLAVFMWMNFEQQVSS